MRGEKSSAQLLPAWLSRIRAALCRATLQAQYEFDGLHIEELIWQLPYGPPTAAIFLKPAGF